MGVAEGLVARELRFRCGHELAALLHVMDAADGETAALLEERAHDFAVDGEAIGFHSFAQQLRFKWVMAAQRGVAAAHDEVGRGGFARDLRDAGADLPVRCGGLVPRHATAIGEDVEQLVFLGKTRANALQAPIRVHRNVVDGLYAGGIVVEHDNLAGVLCDLLREERVDRRFVDDRIGIEDFYGKGLKGHVHRVSSYRVG